MATSVLGTLHTASPDGITPACIDIQLVAMEEDSPKAGATAQTAVDSLGIARLDNAMGTVDPQMLRQSQTWQQIGRQDAS